MTNSTDTYYYMADALGSVRNLRNRRKKSSRAQPGARFAFLKQG